MPMGALRKLLWMAGLGLVCAAWAPACTSAEGTQPYAGLDGGNGAFLADVNVCDALVTRTCGVDDGGGNCSGTAACSASTLTRQYTPDACVALQDDELNYPTCSNRAVQTCGTLVVKVCGEDGGACAGLETCGAAQDVARAGNASLCREALGDETSYPRCIP